MTARDDRETRLERLTDQALHELPQRHAPAALESRVLREIGRGTRSRWRSGCAEWPLAARAALLTGCCASAAFVLLGLSRLAAQVAALGGHSAAGHWLEGLRGAAEAAASIGALGWRLAGMIPTDWLVGCLLAAALLYAMLFALIAAGYSLLFVTPQRSGAHPT